MSLRTYSLMTHPAYLRYVERSLYSDAGPAASEALLPRIDKIQDVAEYLRISHNTIRFLLINTPKNYRTFELVKKSGGVRKIRAPRLFLKVVQWWIKDTIIDVLPVDDAAHGFVRGRSFVTNAQKHLGANYVLNVDIKSCFDSVDAKLIEPIFKKIGYSDAVSLQLSALCSLDGSLPQGAPTSPGLLNQILSDFDRKMRNIADADGLVFSRYADDLTFSADKRIDQSMVDTISENLADIGLRLNPKKTHFMGPNRRKFVTGLTLGDNQVNLPREYLNSLRGWIGHLERKSEISVEEIARLRGTLAMVQTVRASNTERLLKRGREILVSQGGDAKI